MSRRPRIHSRAYRCGWNDGRYAELYYFTENRSLANLECPSERLDYYRGHRAGRTARLRKDHLLEAS